MSDDKRRYLSRHPRNTEKPIAGKGKPTLAKDGYEVRHRETFEYKNDGFVWSRDRDVSPGLREEGDVFDSYLMD